MNGPLEARRKGSEAALPSVAVADKHSLAGAEIGVEEPRLRRRAAPLAKVLDPYDQRGPAEREGHDVAHRQGLGGALDPLAVDPDEAARDQLGRQGPGLREPREPEPLVEALAALTHGGPERRSGASGPRLSARSDRAREARSG